MNDDSLGSTMNLNDPMMNPSNMWMDSGTPAFPGEVNHYLPQSNSLNTGLNTAISSNDHISNVNSMTNASLMGHMSLTQNHLGHSNGMNGGMNGNMNTMNTMNGHNSHQSHNINMHISPNDHLAAFGYPGNLNNPQVLTQTQNSKTNAKNAATAKKIGYRRGKWTVEEEAYANRLISEFKSGMLPLTDGTTLRTSAVSSLRTLSPLIIV